MKTIKLSLLLVVMMTLVPMTILASGGHGHGSDGHEKAKEMSHHDGHDAHGGMSADGSMIIVGNQVSKGVKGMAHLKDVAEAMSKMGMKETHHFMMAFVDTESNDQIESGTVALKITDPDAKVSETIELIGMDGHFGADVVLDMKGEYHFKLGTKLEDGKKRKYHFHYVVK